MITIPAIDLRNGAVVRLRQGDYAQQTTYGDDPAAMARRFEAEGAELLHVVDLDAAREGRRTQAAQVRAITRAVGVPIQLGGGLRTLDDIDAAFNDGAARVVLGTAAVRDPQLVRDAVERHGPERIVVGVDARDGVAKVDGWTASGEADAGELLEAMAALGVRRFVYTDIGRDGALSEPNYAAVEHMLARARRVGAALIASGGVAGIEHLRRLAEIPGLEGTIVGSAIYRGLLDLREAIALSPALPRGGGGSRENSPRTAGEGAERTPRTAGEGAERTPRTGGEGRMRRGR